MLIIGGGFQSINMFIEIMATLCGSMGLVDPTL